MNMKHLIVLVLLVGLLLLVACMSISPTTQNNIPATLTNTRTPKPTSTVSQYISPNLTLTMAALTERPDVVGVSESVKQEIDRLLATNNNCELPCFWGIHTGITPWDEAKLFFERLNNVSPSNYWDGPYQEYYLNFEIFETGKGHLMTGMDISVNEDFIQRIVVSTSQPPAITNDHLFKQYWEHYSLSEVFNRLGVPDAVYLGFVDHKISRGYALRAIYSKENTIVEYSLFPKKNDKICPDFFFGDRVEQIHLSITSVDSGLDILPRLWSSPDVSPNYWRLIHQDLGITEKDFYLQITSDPNTCFSLLSEEQ